MPRSTIISLETLRRVSVGMLIFFLILTGTMSVSAAPAEAKARHPVVIRATTIFAPPDYQPSQLKFQARGALRAVGTWDFPEPEGDEVSIVNFTFHPAGTSDVFVLHVRSRRIVEEFDDQTCTGYAKEVGDWTVISGTGRYANLRGRGALVAKATYAGGDPEQDCNGISEKFRMRYDGVMTSR